MQADEIDYEFFETCPRPSYCPYCGAEMKESEDPKKCGMGGYSMGGIGDVDTFFGRCFACGKLAEVAMDAENYDAETLAKFRAHGFMVEDNESFPAFVIRHARWRFSLWRAERRAKKLFGGKE